MKKSLVAGRLAGLLGLLLISACNQIDPLKKLEHNIQARIAETPGTYAVAFTDMRDRTRQLLINEREEFHAASTMKTPVMIEVFKQAAYEQFSLLDSLAIKNEFRSIVDQSPYSLSPEVDSENKLYERIGEKASIYDLVYDMIIHSSNLATNIIIEKVNAEMVTQSMRSLGAKDIQVLRGVEDTKAYEKGMNNTTTAFDLMVIFEKMSAGEIASPEACETMIDILADQRFNEIIPAQLPREVTVAHKTGLISTASHDSGIVILPDGSKYVLVILSKDWESLESATALMADISKMIYDYYTSFFVS